MSGDAKNRHFELAMNWWLFNGSIPAPGQTFPKRSDDFILFNDLLGEEKLDGSIEYKKNSETIFYGTKIKYVAIVVNTTLTMSRTGFERGLPIRDRWENLINKEVRSIVKIKD